MPSKEVIFHSKFVKCLIVFFSGYQINPHDHKWLDVYSSSFVVDLPAHSIEGGMCDGKRQHTVG